MPEPREVRVLPKAWASGERNFVAKKPVVRKRSHAVIPSPPPQWHSSSQEGNSLQQKLQEAQRHIRELRMQIHEKSELSSELEAKKERISVLVERNMYVMKRNDELEANIKDLETTNINLQDANRNLQEENSRLKSNVFEAKKSEPANATQRYRQTLEEVYRKLSQRDTRIKSLEKQLLSHNDKLDADRGKIQGMLEEERRKNNEMSKQLKTLAHAIIDERKKAKDAEDLSIAQRMEIVNFQRELRALSEEKQHLLEEVGAWKSESKDAKSLYKEGRAKLRELERREEGLKQEFESKMASLKVKFEKDLAALEKKLAQKSQTVEAFKTQLTEVRKELKEQKSQARDAEEKLRYANDRSKITEENHRRQLARMEKNIDRKEKEIETKMKEIEAQQRVAAKEKSLMEEKIDLLKEKHKMESRDATEKIGKLENELAEVEKNFKNKWKKEKQNFQEKLKKERRQSSEKLKKERQEFQDKLVAERKTATDKLASKSEVECSRLRAQTSQLKARLKEEQRKNQGKVRNSALSLKNMRKEHEERVKSLREKYAQDSSAMALELAEMSEKLESLEHKAGTQRDAEDIARTKYLPRLNKLRQRCKKAWLADKESKKKMDSIASATMKIRKLIERCRKRIDPHIPALPSLAEYLQEILSSVPLTFKPGKAVKVTSRNKIRFGTVKQQLEANPRQYIVEFTANEESLELKTDTEHMEPIFYPEASTNKTHIDYIEEVEADMRGKCTSVCVDGLEIEEYDKPIKLEKRYVGDETFRFFANKVYHGEQSNRVISQDPSRKRGLLASTNSSPTKRLRSISISSAEKQSSEWVQCDRCKKWRLLPPEVDVSSLPSQWFCHMNAWDPAHNNCKKPEDESHWGNVDQKEHDHNGNSVKAP